MHMMTGIFSLMAFPCPEWASARQPEVVAAASAASGGRRHAPCRPGTQRHLAVRHPLDFPLGLEAALVLLPDPIVLPGGEQRPEGGLPEVMHEDVEGADDLVVLPPDAQRVVVVLEQADAELLVEGADRLVGLPPHGGAEHGH